MGLEANCRIRYQGSESSGKVVLESQELILRGTIRLKVPFRSIKRVIVEAGRLHLYLAGETLVLELGKEADTWARKIKNPKTLLEKLGVKEGMRITVAGISDAGFLKDLKAKAGGLKNVGAEEVDIIFFQAGTRDELKQVRRYAPGIKKNGALWIIYPKGNKDITQADVFAAGKACGLVDVKVASFSATQSALKFVIPVAKR